MTKSFFHILRFSFLFFLLCFLGFDIQAQVPGDRLNYLAKGINFNDWFTDWAKPATYESEIQNKDAVFLKKAGFTVCRLPMFPDFLFDSTTPEKLNQNVVFADQAVQRLLDNGLAVIFDPLHSSSNNLEWESRMYHDPAFLQKVCIYWEAMAKHFSQFSKDRIFFEVMNEPHLNAKETVAANWWTPIQVKLAQAIRRGAPDNTIIATGDNWSSLNGLLKLPPLTDTNVVYSFHWYEPFTFTHQGAEWANGLQGQLKKIPYPSNPDNVQGAVQKASDSQVKNAILQYGKENWDYQKIYSQLSKAALWSKENKVPVFCGEFGVYRKEADPQDRIRWISDLRHIFESLNIGWAMWDYETDFGIVSYSEPNWHKGVMVDKDCLQALGLDSSQMIASDENAATMDAFSKMKLSSITIPINAWTILWTREPQKGFLTVIRKPDDNLSTLKVVFTGQKDWALSSGLPFSVNPGDKIELSSHASLKGIGSLSLELVARDHDGKVIRWDFAAIQVSSGENKIASTQFIVPSGIATLEPRWSGFNSSEIEVGAFELKHL